MEVGASRCSALTPPEVPSRRLGGGSVGRLSRLLATATPKISPARLITGLRPSHPRTALISHRVFLPRSLSFIGNRALSQPSLRDAQISCNTSTNMCANFRKEHALSRLAITLMINT